MKDIQVSAAVEGGIMTVTFDNPEMKNGLNWIGINQFADCYEKAIADEENIRVIVFTGNDEFFYTGGRVDPTVPGEKEKYAEAISRFEKASHAVRTPRVAAVSGDCLKAGMGLLEACDFAVAREGVQFGYPEVRMGGVPMMVMAETYGNMPKKRALEAYLTSWSFSAEEAYRMGLVNRVVPKEQFRETVDAFVRIFLDTPRPLIEMTRKAFHDLGSMSSYEERAQYCMDMLKKDVLTTMATSKTEFNV